MKTPTSHRLLACLGAVALLTLAAPQAVAQYQVTTFGGAVVENFNGLSSSAGSISFTGDINSDYTNTSAAQRLAAWTLMNGTSNTTPTIVANDAGTGTGGGFRAYGNNTSNPDRSLGALGNGTFGNNAGTAATMTAQYQNVTGGIITSFILDYVGEQWREQTSRPSFITVSYSFDGITFFDAPASMDFNAIANATNQALNGDASGNRTALGPVNINTGVNVANGDSIYIRWTYNGGGGTGSRQGLAIDDISLTFNGEAPPVGDNLYWTANGTTLGGAGTWDTTGSNWSPTDDPVVGGVWDSTKRAVFEGTAGAVTVDTVTTEAGIQFSTTGYTLSSGTITLGGETAADNSIITDADVTATINSTLSGDDGMMKAGAGTLILGGANDYSGGTVVIDGRLVGTTTSLQGDIANNAAVTFDQGANGTYAGNMTGGGSLLFAGAGTVTLSGTNTYSGGTEVADGGIVGTTDSVQGNINNNGTVTFDQAANGTYAGDMSGNGELIQAGAGTVTLSGTNTYSGGTTVADGGLVGTTTSLQGDIANDGTVTFDQASSGTYAGEMSGSGELIKRGGGNVTLSASNSYTGGTTINAGTLTAGNDDALGVGDVAIAAAGRLLASDGVTVANDITVGIGYGTLYSQDFNNIGTELPDGWTVRTGANASSLGTATNLVVAAPDDATNSWGNASGGFKNFASATGLTESSDAAAQAASEDRALGIRQTAAIGDPGAAFTYQFSTTGETVDAISFDLMMLSVQTRSTAWSIQYGLGADPASYVTLGTWDDPSEWGTTPIVFTTDDFGTALNNQDDVVFRVVALTGSSGTGSRDSMALDNFFLGSGTDVTTPGATIGSAGSDTAVFSGLITLDGTAQLTAGAGGEAIFSGQLAGVGGTRVIADSNGTVTFTGSSANTYTGDTTVSSGTLQLAKTDNTTAVAGDITVSAGATLLIAADNQVADTSVVTLSGGTIQLDGTEGRTETFGDLNVTSASILDFGNAIGANMSFEEYAPVELLTINNFIGWSTLTFTSDLTGFINDEQYFSFSNGFTSAVWDEGSGVFTITAIPEPSTYAAAAGLIALMMWPARRRLLKDAKSILGMRQPMRDRLASRR